MEAALCAAWAQASEGKRFLSTYGQRFKFTYGPYDFVYYWHTDEPVCGRTSACCGSLVDYDDFMRFKWGYNGQCAKCKKKDPDAGPFSLSDLKDSDCQEQLFRSLSRGVNPLEAVFYQEDFLTFIAHATEGGGVDPLWQDLSRPAVAVLGPGEHLSHRQPPCSHHWEATILFGRDMFGLTLEAQEYRYRELQGARDSLTRWQFHGESPVPILHHRMPSALVYLLYGNSLSQQAVTTRRGGVPSPWLTQWKNLGRVNP